MRLVQLTPYQLRCAPTLAWAPHTRPQPSLCHARRRRRLRTTGITTFTVHAPSNTILFLSGNELFSYQPFAAADNRPILVDDGSDGTCMDPKFCPSDPDLISFIRSNALCVARVSTGTCTVLAKGHGGLTIGTPPYIIQEEFDRYTGYWWRDDAYGGYAILYEEVDEVEIDRTPIVDFTRPSTCDDFPCPLAGSANAKVTLKLAEFPETIGDPTADATGAPIVSNPFLNRSKGRLVCTVVNLDYLWM